MKGEDDDGATLRIISCTEFGEFMRLTNQEWTYAEAQQSEVTEAVRDSLTEFLRNSGPLKSRDGQQALLMDCGGWAEF